MTESHFEEFNRLVTENTSCQKKKLGLYQLKPVWRVLLGQNSRVTDKIWLTAGAKDTVM